MSDAHGVARDQLRAFIERIERLEEEKKTIADDIKDVYGEAKAMGYMPAIMKKIVALRKKDDQQRMEEEQILDTYLQALGMIPQFELFEEGEAPVQNKQPAMALQSPRHAEEAVSERAVINQPETASETRSASTGAPETPGKQCTIVVSKDEAGQNLTGTTIPENAPASQGDAEAPSVERVTPGAAANTGGDNVTDAPTFAAPAGVLVRSAPATFTLRPDCLKPENCAGYGSTHCHSCKKEAQGREAA